MKLLERFWQPLVALTLVLSISVPSLATAQDTLDPFDDNIQEFLASLDIEVGPTETLWQDKEFVEFVSSYQNIEAEVRAIQESFVTIAHEALDLLEAGVQIEDRRVRDALELPRDLTDAELQEIKMELNSMRTELDNAAELFLSEDALLQEMGGIDGLFDMIELITLFDDYDEYDDYNYDDQLWVYAWADTYDAVEAGNIVTLMSEIEGPFSEEEVEVTWTQTYGPEVTWLNTDSPFNAAFIVPNYDTLGDEMYLEFEVTVKAGDQEDYSFVFVDLVMG